MNLCSLHLHKWSNWSKPYVIAVNRLAAPWNEQGYTRGVICECEVLVTVQERFCVRCNKLRVEMVIEGDASPWEEEAADV